MIYNYFKKFFKYFKESKYEFLRYAAFSFIASVLELMGVALIYPFVIKVLSGNENKLSVIIGGLIVGLFILKNLFMVFFINLQAKFIFRMELIIKRKFMEYFLFSDYQDTYKISLAEKGKILNTLIPNIMNNFLFRLLNLIINTFIFFMITALLAIKFPLATLITLIFAIVLTVMQNKIYKPMLTRISSKISKLTVPLNQAVNEATINLKSVKISNNEQFFFNNYIESVKNINKENEKLAFLQQIPPYITEPVAIFLLFILLVVISIQNYIDPAKLIASFALIASAIFRLAPTISRIQVNINGINSALPMVKEFIDLYERYNIYEKTKELETKSFVKLEKDIEFKNVNFGYEQNKEILHDINLKINKGEFIGLAGESGVGKTTLIDVLIGLYEPTSGEILIDGHENSNPLKIGYVPQDFKLINGNIRENVAFGNSEIDDERVKGALKNALLLDYIEENYEEGIYADPFVDSNGFSQGQKQRLAIARALYSEPDILILDEATSSLDLVTEEKFCQTLNELKGKLTIIVIAHRLSTIKSADRVVYMENGKIIAIAPFNELSVTCEGFKNLVKIYSN